MTGEKRIYLVGALDGPLKKVTALNANAAIRSWFVMERQLGEATTVYAWPLERCTPYEASWKKDVHLRPLVDS